MINVMFDDRKRFVHHLSGKFLSPGSDWIHLTRNLTDFELFVVTDGTLSIADEHRSYTVESSGYLLMPPTVFQHGTMPGSCSFYWMHIAAEMGYTVSDAPLSYAPEKLCIPLSGTLKSMDRIIVLMKQLQDSDRRYHNPALNDCLAAAILNELCCQGSEYEKYEKDHQTTQLFNDITDYVLYHSCEALKVTEIADYFGYNPKYISTLFHNQSGITLKQYMLQTKMDAAKAQLSDTNHPISQIACSVGFCDAHNFTNAFKKMTGLSPTEYRQSYGKRELVYR